MKSWILTLVLIGLAVNTSFAQSKNEMKTFDPAFAHVVYFWFKDPDNKADRVKFEASLKKFLKNSEFAKTNFIGTPPVSTREVVDDSYTYALIVTFESAEAQEGYQKEESHLTFIEECKDLWEKVIVYDSFGLSE